VLVCVMLLGKQSNESIEEILRWGVGVHCRNMARGIAASQPLLPDESIPCFHRDRSTYFEVHFFHSSIFHNTYFENTPQWRFSSHSGGYTST
jgi:hypothetical protein